MNSRFVVRAVASLFAVVAAPGFSADTTANLTVEASIADACTVTGATLNFGAYDPRPGAVLDAQQNITVNCTNTTPYAISMSVGGGTGASYTARVLESAGSDALNYNLYTTGGRTVVWGDGTGSTDTVDGTGSGGNQNVAVFGRILSGQSTAPVADYADSVTITVTY